MLTSHNRFKYSGIKQRPKYSWPDGKRLAVYVAVNIEHFPYGVQCGVDLDRQTQPWSQRSWLWREYGNRVGEWRLIDLFDELNLPAGVIVNTENYLHCPELITAHRQRGDEMIAHGRSNAERQIDMAEDVERTMVQEVTAFMAQADGIRPAGWLSPYLTPSLVTTDLLAEAGYSYVLDWGICDEQPFWVRSRSGPILSVPYPIELNDQPTVVFRHSSAADYADMIVDNFDEMLRRSEDTPLVYVISLHSFIMGQPFRLARLRRALQHVLSHRDQTWLTLPGEIARHYRSLPNELQLHAE
jgi:peptidoglycan/xylan/chitin deacetylase (PgdA/CDA1 family)